MPASDPREVIAGASRKQHRVAYEHEWTKTDLDYYHGNVADAIITALHDAGYEIVRADREPDAPEITEAMIRAGYDKFGDLGWHDSHEEEEASIHADLRAVLEAAMKARR